MVATASNICAVNCVATPQQASRLASRRRERCPAVRRRLDLREEFLSRELGVTGGMGKEVMKSLVLIFEKEEAPLASSASKRSEV